jgi:rubrerythrin
VGRYAFDAVGEAEDVVPSAEVTPPPQEEITKKTVAEILKQALAREKEAYKVYSDAKEILKDPGAKKLISDLAAEELGHVRKLEHYKAEGLKPKEMKKIQDLHISDYLVDKELTPDMHLQDVLIFAMKREKKAHEFYLNISEAVDEGDAKQLFNILAQEELSHKNKLEIFYDDLIYKED